MQDGKELSARPDTSYLRGALYGIAAVSIWAGWISATRAGVTTSLSPADLTFLRFSTAGLVLLPVLLKRGIPFKQVPFWLLAVIICGAGAPYVHLASTGLRYVPASQGGVLIPGVMPLFVGILSVLLLKERYGPKRRTGYGLIILGVLCIVGTGLVASGVGQLFGYALLLCSALSWACYTLAFRVSRLEPLHCAALISVISALLYAPYYFGVHGLHFMTAPWQDTLFQALFQGIVATVLSLFLYGRAIALLGASAGATFGALVPVLAALMGVAFLAETPSPTDWLGIAATSCGVYLASGGPLPFRRLKSPA